MRAIRILPLLLVLASCAQLKPLPQWSIELVSRSLDGEAYQTASAETGLAHNISANGKFVVYVGAIDATIYLRDLETGSSTVVAEAADRAVDLPCVNEDGTRVVYAGTTTYDGTLADRAHPNIRWDAYMVDISDGASSTPTLLTARADGPAIDDSAGEANSDTNWPGLALSADGGAMAVGSWDSHLASEDHGVIDSFVYFRELGDPLGPLRWLSENLTGGPVNDRAYGPVLSRDGSYAAFVARAQSLPGGSADTARIYWRPTALDSSMLLRALSSGRAEDMTPVTTDGPSLSPSISGDGQHVAYASLATNLVHGQQTGDGSRFLLFQVSNVSEGPAFRVEPHFIAATGLLSTEASATNDPDTVLTRTSLSDDGRFLAFSSKCALADLLIPNCDTAARYSQVYIYDSVADEFTQLTFGEGDSYAPSMSADATAISFVSEAPDLVDGMHDNNSGPDIYVARWHN